MYFLFLTYKVKCSAVTLNITDCQNMHSMSITVRALIKLFKSVKHKKELNQKILAYLISHDYRLVRIYSYYLMIKEDETIFYLYLICTFDFTK